MSKILQPTYMKKFSCIGGACEDSCCIGWHVFIDKHTYHNYKSMRQPQLKNIMKNKLKRNKKNAFEHSYGEIKMNSDGRCPFLNEKNLCNIYIEAGEKHLSDTCTHYPRRVNRIGNGLERSASMSCPEIVREALFNKDGLVFEEVEENIDKKILINHTIRLEENNDKVSIKDFFWEIRMFSLTLLQNRKYSLSDRLVLLGICYKNLMVLEKENLEEIPDYIEKFSSQIESGSFKDALNTIPTDLKIQFQLARELTEQKNLSGVSSIRYKECLKDMLVGLGFAEGNTYERIIERYQSCYNNAYLEYFNEKEYILENYLVNEFFRGVMPFATKHTLWSSYVYTCFLYGMLKLHLIGMSGSEIGLNDEMVTKCIQSFSKVILHNPGYISRMIKLLDENGFNELAHMSILVKN